MAIYSQRLSTARHLGTPSAKELRSLSTSLLFTILFVISSLPLFGSGMRVTPKSRTRHDFFLGTVWKNNTAEDHYFNTYWNQVTTENGGKWKNVESHRDQMNWTDLDNAYHHAALYDMPFRLHTLIWGQSQPLWLLDLSAEEQLEETEEWFSQVAERYPDIDFIDVVNEPLHEQPFNVEVYGGTGETGFDWVITIFEMARRYFPNSALEINDYDLIGTGTLTPYYVKLAEILKTRKLIDAIGMQAHQLENANPSEVSKNLATLAGAGLPMYVTELTMAISDDQAQLNQMKGIVEVMTANEAVKGITTWGYLEGAIYSPNAMLLRADGTERPALSWLTQHYQQLGR